MMTRTLLLCAALAACGGGSTAPAAGGGTTPPPPADTRTAFERRLDDACLAVGKRLSMCALEDASARLEAGETTQAEYDATTQPDVLKANAQKWRDTCYQPDRSSRQVRVLEVCDQQETACDPLVACLENLNTPVAAPAPR